MSKISKKGKIIACLDIGSSKLVCIIASISAESVKILGYGHKESNGIKSSTISDMRVAQKSIQNVVAQAERMAGLNIDKVLVSISGTQSHSSIIDDNVKINDIVKASDIDNLANKIRQKFKQNNREVIHLIPIEYRIDDSLPVINPRYMSGNKLYARFHVVSVSITTINNIEHCLKNCQISAQGYICEPYSSALSCLSKNEMRLGSLVLNMGFHATSIAMILDGKFIRVANLPIGGFHITKDISTIFNISLGLAEQIKNLNSSLFISPIEEKEMIKMKLASVGEIEDNAEIIGVTRIKLRDIIESRLEEIFESTKELLQNSKIPSYAFSNIVLTGGVSTIVGIDKLANEIFDKNVKIGYPNKLNISQSEILSPANCCAIGMLVFLKNRASKEKSEFLFKGKSGFFGKIFDKLVGI